MKYLRTVIISMAVFAITILIFGSVFAEMGDATNKENNTNKGGIMKTNDKTESATAFVLPPLPYAQNALEPAISANTISFHYG